MNTKKTTITVAMIAMMVAMILAAPASAQVEVQIGMAIDGSTSIDNAEWAAIVDGIADAVNDPNCVPHDGTVELTVVQFAGTTATLEVGPEVITAANVATVVNDIRNIGQNRGTTPLAHGIHLTADTMANSANFNDGIGVKQVINIATDGVPNVVDPDFGGTDGKASAILARDYAITTLAMTSEDEIDAEGIGISDDNRDWLLDHIVYPQPGSIATGTPYPDPGWVRVVANAQEFAESMCEKFGAIIDEPCCAPVPVGPSLQSDEDVPLLTPFGAVLLIGLLAIVGAVGIRRRT